MSGRQAGGLAVGARCPGALTQPGEDGGPLGSELSPGQRKQSLAGFCDAGRGWVERNFFFCICIIHLFDLGLPGSTGSLLWCMDSAVMTQQLSSCSTRAWLLH